MHPAPEVTARPAADDEIGRSASALIAKATTGGWETRATYARGTDPGKKALPVVDSIMVRLSKGPMRAVAVFHDGSFTLGYAWVPAAPLLPRPRGYKQLVHLVGVA